MAEFLLFVQHGWADNNRAMLNLAQQLVADTTPIIAPNLGYIQTWLRIAPLIDAVEAIATQQLSQHPDLLIRIVGHSMGGLIWLEVLNRHPDWWPRVESLVLVGSPVGGADLGRLIDPLQWGIGIAHDLGINRKAIAATIAEAIPTLVIAGDVDGGSDGTVPVSCTRFPHARFVSLQGLSHPVLRNHPLVASLIRQFWQDATVGESIVFNDVVERLHRVPGMTDGHCRDFHRAAIAVTLDDGISLWTWRAPWAAEHVFVVSPEGALLYSGFVGWRHLNELHQALADIQRTYGVSSKVG